MDIGLSSRASKQIAEELSDLLATTYALYLKTQNFHWNLKGQNFISLHLLFEKNYKEMADAVDEIAERIRSVGFDAEGSFSAFQKRSKIPEAKKALSQQKVIQELLEGHEEICRMGRKMIRLFQVDLKDDISSDLVIKQVSFHDKAAWILRSHL